MQTSRPQTVKPYSLTLGALIEDAFHGEDANRTMLD